MNTLLLFVSFLFPPTDSPSILKESENVQETGAKEQIELVVSEPGENNKLLKKIYTKTLIAMTNSENVGVKCYAFSALVKLNHHKVKEIFLKHLQDTEKLVVGINFSSLVQMEQVNQYMLDQLHPETSKCTYRLTKQEYENYRKLVYNTIED